MTAGGRDFTLNPEPKIYAYINRHGRFDRYLISKGWGVHEMRVLPERVDGDLVIYAADEIQPHKFDEMTTYVNYWIIGPRDRKAGACTAPPTDVGAQYWYVRRLR